MVRAGGDSLDGKTWGVSGSGNGASFAIGKVHQPGGKVGAVSDSTGAAIDEDGIDLDLLKQIKIHERGRIKDYVVRRPGAPFAEHGTICPVPCDVAMPCATQNELSGHDALALIRSVAGPGGNACGGRGRSRWSP